MASIRKMRERYYVLYDWYDLTGKRRQKSESFFSKEEAMIRKSEIEFLKRSGRWIKQSDKTTKQFLLEWISIHAKKYWQHQTYSSTLLFFENHVFPHIGDIPVNRLSPIHIDSLISTLRTTKTIRQSSGNELTKYLSGTTIRYIYTQLKQAMDDAVAWKLLCSNPVTCKPPKKDYHEQPIWTPDIVLQALNEIPKHSLLHLAVHLSFVCSLRIGEILGITLDCIDLSNNRILIDKAIQRISKNAFDELPNNNISKVLTSIVQNSTSLLVLKTPKTKTSIRYVYFSDVLKEEIEKRLVTREKENVYFSHLYNDHNLLFALEDGSPIEPGLCSKWFRKWQRSNWPDREPLVFHGLRHSSATYKLLLSNGDYKTVQKDTGHASADVLLNIYAHSQEENRKALIQRIELDLYK